MEVLAPPAEGHGERRLGPLPRGCDGMWLVGIVCEITHWVGPRASLWKVMEGRKDSEIIITLSKKKNGERGGGVHNKIRSIY